MAKARITLGVRKRWLLRQGSAGVLLSYVLMKLGAPVGWFVAIHEVEA